METPPYRYDEYVSKTNEEVMQNLFNYGVAIVPNVLNEEECSNMYSGMIGDLEHITQSMPTPFKHADESTWRTWWELAPMHSMLQQHWKLGHTQTIWNIRQNPKVVKVFEDIWKTPSEQLLTSFDGVTLHFPPEKTRRGWYRNTWLHTDQSFMRPEFECVQSWITALDVNEGDGTLTYLKGSHKFHERTRERFQITDKKDWFKIDKEIFNYYVDELDCPQECIKCPAGSMVLWDSRLMHCGREPTKGREKENTRCVSYVCMTPRFFAKQSQLTKKQKAFNELRLTTHWPHRVKLFAKVPRLYGNPVPNVTDIEAPVLSELGKKLAGF